MIIIHEIYISIYLAFQPLPPLPSLVSLSLNPPIMEVHQHTTVSTTTQTTCLSTTKASTSIALTGIVKPTPSIAVTHIPSSDKEEKKIILTQHVKPSSHHGGKRKDIKKHSQHKSKHSTLDRVHRWEISFILLFLLPLFLKLNLIKTKVFFTK